MSLVLLLVAALTSGLAVALAAARWPRAAMPPRPRRARLAARLDPEALTGLALTLALALLVCGGVVLAALAFVLRGDPQAFRLDAGAANWSHRHATPFTTGVLEAISFVGAPHSIAVLALFVAAAETVRTRSRWVVPFLVLVVAGNGLLTTTIKQLADRVRPALNPIAETLGPSFPSGHSSWSAACFAAAALLLARGRGRRARIVLAGAAAGAAVAVASSRVLLDVHWLSDVVAGLALGWAWFAACAIAFGGRLLRFGATAERAAAPPAGAGAVAHEPSARGLRSRWASAVDHDRVHRSE
jgi:membrane-associated phospholipid phosphatase